tara:strand:+ start:175 stop:330 length:156 start_codon:yes stop_codon:yes gene_type:complete
VILRTIARRVLLKMDPTRPIKHPDNNKKPKFTRTNALPSLKEVSSETKETV